MKILKQLSKFFLFTFLLINPVSANEPVDIWNIEKKDTKENKNGMFAWLQKLNIFKKSDSEKQENKK